MRLKEIGPGNSEEWKGYPCVNIAFPKQLPEHDPQPSPQSPVHCTVELTVFPYTGAVAAERVRGNCSLDTREISITVRLPQPWSELVDPTKGWLRNDGSLLCELTVCSLPPGITADDGQPDSSCRLIIEKSEAARRVLRTSQVGTFRLPPESSWCRSRSRSTEEASLVVPVSRTDSRLFFVHDFPTVAIKPTNEHIVLPGRLFGGTTKVILYPNGAADLDDPDRFKDRLVIGILVPTSSGESIPGKYTIRLLNHALAGQTDRVYESKRVWKDGDGVVRAFPETREILRPGSGWLTEDGGRTLVFEVTVTIFEGVDGLETSTGATLRDTTLEEHMAAEEVAGEELRDNLGALLPARVAQPNVALSDDLGGGLDDGKAAPFTDAVIVCEGARIPVHRVILAARSPVFAAMFASVMREGRSGEVEAESVRRPVMEELLHFLYTGRLLGHPLHRHRGGASGRRGAIEELYRAAHHYQVHSLTRLLECFLLTERPTPDAMVHRLLLAEDHSLADLKAHYARILRSDSSAAGNAYLTAVLESDSYKAHIANNARGLTLLVEVCHRIAPAAAACTPLRDRIARLREQRAAKAKKDAADTAGVSEEAAVGSKRRRTDAGDSDRKDDEWRPRLRKKTVHRLTTEELGLELSSRGLSTQGNKAALQARLEAALVD